MRPSTISQIGAFTAFTPAAPGGDHLRIAPSRCSGFGDADLRVTEEDAPSQDGSDIEPPLDSGLILTIAGDFVVVSTGLSSEAGYRDAVEAMYQSLKTAINAGKTAAIDLVHAGGTLKVWKHSKLEQGWDDLETVCSVTFSLIEDVFA